MSHHKRKRPKSTRAGCLLCKPHKRNGTKGTLEAQTWQERKARLAEQEQKEDYDRSKGHRRVQRTTDGVSPPVD
jgi:hypothetical protein